MSWVEALVSGVASAFAGRSSRNSSNLSYKEQRDLAILDAENTRRQRKEDALLTEWMRQNKRSEVSRGSKNYTQFAGPMAQGYSRTAPPVADSPGTPDQFINSGGIVQNLRGGG
jgi:hypothetical protein